MINLPENEALELRDAINRKLRQLVKQGVVRPDAKIDGINLALMSDPPLYPVFARLTMKMTDGVSFDIDSIPVGNFIFANMKQPEVH